MNKAVRDALLALSRAFPDDRKVGAFVTTLSRDRNALWETWKQSVPTELVQRVREVRVPHHGSGMHQAGRIRVGNLSEEYSAVAKEWRQKITELLESRRSDAVVSRSLEKIIDHLAKLDASLK